MQPQSLLKPIRGARWGSEAAAWKDDVSISITAHMTEHMFQSSFPRLALSLLYDVHITFNTQCWQGSQHKNKHTVHGTKNEEMESGMHMIKAEEMDRERHLALNEHGYAICVGGRAHTHNANTNCVCRHVILALEGSNLAI